MGSTVVRAKFDGTQDSVPIQYTGMLSGNPFLIPGKAVITDGTATIPEIGVLGAAGQSSAVIATTIPFKGYVDCIVIDQRVSGVSAAAVVSPGSMSYAFDSDLGGNPGPALSALNGTSSPIYQRFGRKGQAVYVPGTTGYGTRGDPGYPAPGSGNGWAWMGFVWVESLGATQGVIWQEGNDLSSTYIAGVKIWIDSSGYVNASIGAAGTWAFTMTSARTVGTYSWHHVALVWDGTNAYLYVDGAQDQSRAYALAPQSSATSPIAFGAQYGSPNGTNVLNGSLDEIKFVTFAIRGGLGFVLQQPWLSFRQTVITDLKNSGIIANNVAGENTLNQPTRTATNILRAWVNSFFRNANAGLPVGSYDDTLSSVYPIDGVLVAGALGVNSIYQNLKNNVFTGTCGIAAHCLWGVYQAFGFESHRYDTVNNEDVRYNDSHVLVEVFCTDAGKVFIQDPTYNHNGIQVAGAASPGTYNRIIDIPFYSGGPSLPWGNDGYSYNTDVRFPVPSLATYKAYFKTFVDIVPAYHKAVGE